MLTAEQETSLEGCYRNMLRMIPQIRYGNSRRVSAMHSSYFQAHNFLPAFLVFNESHWANDVRDLLEEHALIVAKHVLPESKAEKKLGLRALTRRNTNNRCRKCQSSTMDTQVVSAMVGFKWTNQ